MTLEGPFSIGIDAGNASVKIAVADTNKKLIYSAYKLHKNKILDTYKSLLSELEPEIKSNIIYAAASGAFASLFSPKEENQTECLVKGARALYPQAASIAEIGSQNSQFIAGLKSASIQLSANKNCASGTGSFFEEQIARLGTKIEDYSAFVEKADSIPRIAGRCSVFAKTDIIHLQQEGERVENILKGLAYSVVNNFKGTIIQHLPIEKPLLLAGACSKNAGLIAAFKDILALEDSDFIYGPESSILQAFGCSLFALENKRSWKTMEAYLLEKGKERIDGKAPVLKGSVKLAPLKNDYPSENLHPLTPFSASEALYLGIDVGSTSTNFVLLNEKNEVVDIQYFKTLGNTTSAVKRGFDSLEKRFGKLNIVSSGVTGSGRIHIAEKFNIQFVHDEITAQSQGTLFLVPDCDTIFEIGGQDAKFISCKNGIVTDFTMNKVCSAGTGSFVEDQAELLGMTASELGQLALRSESPSLLEQRCTVFMKTSIENKLALGQALEDVAAGLCYAVVNNYLHKVVANKKIGKKICFQGGLAYNQGIVAAFKSYFGQAFSITPYFSVTGALGMALLAKEESRKLQKKEVDKEILELNKKLFDNIQKTTFGLYTGEHNPGKKTIGIPRSLMIYKLFPFAYTYFTSLGFNVKLSGESCEETVRKSQQLVKEETCFPVKLIYGHIQELLEEGCDYIFLPSVYSLMHKNSNLKNNYGCLYMQTAVSCIAENLELEKKGVKLINPVLQMDMGAPHMAKTMLKIGLSLEKNPLLCQRALVKSGMALKKAQKLQEEDGKKFLQRVSSQDKVLVLITRTYGLIDSVLNMGLPQLLLERGCKIITLGNLEGHDVNISEYYKNLYWPFSQHILSGAQIIKNTPNLYALYLTNHGCGPDAMVNHLFAEIMGDKPYLQIEVDEHYSKVGLITRIEAFLLNLNKIQNEKKRAPLPVNLVYESLGQVKKEYPLYIPSYDKLVEYLCKTLEKQGYKAFLLPPTNEESLAIGKDNTTSKEYVSFIALLGDVLKFARDNPKSSEIKQLLLFQTEGGESDGFYAMVIRSKLNMLGRDDIVIIAPKIEELIFAQDREFQAFWQVLAKTDEAFEKEFSHKEEYEGEKDSYILITGDPLIYLNKGIRGAFFEYIKELPFYYRLSSLREYMLFLWQDRIRDKSKVGRAELGLARKRINRISKELPDLKKIRRLADSSCPLLVGANIRYRFARRCYVSEKLRAIIELSSVYENAQTILNMKGKASLPCFCAQFDGNEEKELFQKLQAFLKLTLT
ncbi:MAG: acyl-CoA dehydratase activase [Treponemataceae bacterium]|nr:acyl-CoA dehydratase activase [Treponemataceae bacterium]